MDGVTDAAMRYIYAKVAKPDIIFTEQISVEAIVRAPFAIEKRLQYSAIEQPIICQLSGYTPELFEKACGYVIKLGFAGVDINLGCPVKPTDKYGGLRGAGLIGQYDIVENIIQSCRNTIHRVSKDSVSLSVKTRTGKSIPITKDWISFLASLPLDAITLHGRTLKQGYAGIADWNEIAEGAKIVKNEGKVFLGNGDVQSYEDALEKCRDYGLDGVLIGRAALGNPWIFNKPLIIQIIKEEDKLRTMVEHANYFEKVRGEEPFFKIRKHLGWYARGFDGAKELREKLVRSESLEDVANIVKNNIIEKQ